MKLTQIDSETDANTFPNFMVHEPEKWILFLSVSEQHSKHKLFVVSFRHQFTMEDWK